MEIQKPDMKFEYPDEALPDTSGAQRTPETQDFLADLSYGAFFSETAPFQHPFPRANQGVKAAAGCSSFRSAVGNTNTASRGGSFSGGPANLPRLDLG